MNIPVEELQDNPDMTRKYLWQVYVKVVGEDGINMIVLGYLGLAQYGEELKEANGIKVIAPVFMAFAWAELAAQERVSP